MTKELMPKEIWYGRDPEYGTSAYCHSEQPPCHTRYIRADLSPVTEEERETALHAFEIFNDDTHSKERRLNAISMHAHTIRKLLVGK